MIILIITLVWIVSGILSGIFWRVGWYFLKYAEYLGECQRYGDRPYHRKPTLTTTWKDVFFYCFLFPLYPLSFILSFGFMVIQAIHALWMYVDSNPALDKPICNCFESTKKEIKS